MIGDRGLLFWATLYTEQDLYFIACQGKLMRREFWHQLHFTTHIAAFRVKRSN